MKKKKLSTCLRCRILFISLYLLTRNDVILKSVLRELFFPLFLSLIFISISCNDVNGKIFVEFEIKIKAFYFDGHDIQSEKFSRNKHTHSSRYIITLKYRIFGWVVFNETCYLRFLVVIFFFSSFSYCVIFFTSSKSYHTALYYMLLYICAISCNRNLKEKKKQQTENCW